MANRIQLRRGTAAQWAAANPVLAQGEPGIETDTGKQKFGDGVTRWSVLAYASKGDRGPAGPADDTTMTEVAKDPASKFAAALSATIGTSSVRVEEAPLDPVRYGATGDGVTDDGPALQRALNALPAGGKGVIGLRPNSVYVTSTPLDVISESQVAGHGASSRIRYTGPGAFATLLNLKNIKFRNFRVTITNPTATAFDLSNAFRNTFTGMVIDGGHTGASGSTYHSQRGFRFRDNAGDNRIHDCDINNFGEAFRTESIQNYVSACDIGTAYKAVRALNGGGLIVTGGTITAPIGSASHFFHATGMTNQTAFTQVWMEGADIGVELGDDIDGPIGFQMIGGKMAASSKNIVINKAKLATFIGTRLSANPGFTPTPLVIGPNAGQGVMIGVLNDMGFDLDTTVFPPDWTFIGRDKVRLPLTHYGNLDQRGSVLATAQKVDEVPLAAKALAGSTASLFEVYKGPTRRYFISDSGVVNSDTGFVAPYFDLQNSVTLPAPVSGNRGQIRLIENPQGTQDVAYICVRVPDGSFAWKQITLGT